MCEDCYLRVIHDNHYKKNDLAIFLCKCFNSVSKYYNFKCCKYKVNDLIYALQVLMFFKNNNIGFTYGVINYSFTDKQPTIIIENGEVIFDKYSILPQPVEDILIVQLPNIDNNVISHDQHQKDKIKKQDEIQEYQRNKTTRFIERKKRFYTEYVLWKYQQYDNQ